MTSRGRREKPSDARTLNQVVDMPVSGMGAGDFYIPCPDNDVTRDTDVRRINWAAGNITKHRPERSHRHPDYNAPFERFLNPGQPATIAGEHQREVTPP